MTITPVLFKFIQETFIAVFNSCAPSTCAYKREHICADLAWATTVVVSSVVIGAFSRAFMIIFFHFIHKTFNHLEHYLDVFICMLIMHTMPHLTANLFLLEYIIYLLTRRTLSNVFGQSETLLSTLSLQTC
jgi:hypothetical protein